MARLKEELSSAEVSNSQALVRESVPSGDLPHSPDAVPLFLAGKRKRCWCFIAIIYGALAALWVCFGVIFPYFVHGIVDVEHRWSIVLPDLGSTRSRAICMGSHFIAGAVITIVGFWQVCPLSRRPNWIMWHRVGGRIYVICSFVAAMGGLGFILQQKRLVGGYEMTAAFSLYGVLVIICAAKTWTSARRKDIDAHRRWALRAFSLGIASFLYRFYFFFAVGAHLIKAAPQADKVSQQTLYYTPFMQFDEWWFFLPNLFVVEWLIRARVGKLQNFLLDMFLAVAAGIFTTIAASLTMFAFQVRRN